MVFQNIVKRCFSTIRFTKSHEYLKDEAGHYTLGITKFAADSLGEIVYLSLPKEGDIVTKDQAILEVDSIKAVSEINTPISGEIINVNNKLEDDTSLINNYPLDKGWIVKIKSSDDINNLDLMNTDDYNEYIKDC